MSMIDRAFVFSVFHLLLLVYISDYLQDILHSCVLDKTNANTLLQSVLNQIKAKRHGAT